MHIFDRIKYLAQTSGTKQTFKIFCAGDISPYESWRLILCMFHFPNIITSSTLLWFYKPAKISVRRWKELMN